MFQNQLIREIKQVNKFLNKIYFIQKVYLDKNTDNIVLIDFYKNGKKIEAKFERE